MWAGAASIETSFCACMVPEVDSLLPPDPGDEHGYLRAVNGELTFPSHAHAFVLDRSLEFVDLELAEWGSGAWTVVAVQEDEMRWPGREDLLAEGLKVLRHNC